MSEVQDDVHLSDHLRILELTKVHLKGLSTGSQDFTVRVREIVESELKDCSEKQLAEALEEILETVNDDRNLQFCSFYSLFFLYRRQYQYKKLSEMIEKYYDYFFDEPLVEIVRSTDCRFKFEQTMKKEYLDEALESAEKVLSDPKFNKTRGVSVHWSELIAMSVNFGYLVDPSKLKEAQRLVKVAIKEKSNYPKYYFILSRIYLAENNYIEALKNIQKAIITESGDDTKTVMRRFEYQQFLTHIQIRISNRGFVENVERASERIDAINASLNENRAKIIEYLSFFSGILALIITTIQITTRLEHFYQALGLVMAMTGLLVFAFSLFIWITRDGSILGSLGRFLPVWVLSLALAFGGSLFGLYGQDSAVEIGKKVSVVPSMLPSAGGVNADR